MKTVKNLVLALVVAMSVSTPALGSYKETVLSDRPEAYWRLGEPWGNVAIDSSGYGRHATYSGPPIYGQPGALTGDADTSVIFDSADLVQADSSGLVPNLDSWSVEAWVKVPVTNRYMAVASWFPGGYLWGHNSRYLLAINEKGLPTFDVRDVNANSVSATGGAPITDSLWHHLVGVLDRQEGRLKLYLDGEEIASAPVVVLGVISDSGIFFNVGGQPRYWASSWQFTGMMDEVAIYRAALGADRVRYHYGMGRGLTSDADGDTVADAIDKCPNTPPGSVVDSIGCIASCPTQATQASIDAAVLKAVTPLKATIAARDATIAAKDATIAAKDVTISSLNADVNQLLATVATKDETIASLQSQISGLNTTVSGLQQQIAALQGQILGLDRTIADQLQQIAALNGQISVMFTKQQLDQAVFAAQQAVAASTATTLSTIFNDPSFVLPGATLTEQVTSLTNAIGNMPTGQIRKLQELLTP